MAVVEHDLDGLARMHLPTARVSLEAVVRFLIVDLMVEPAVADWRERLEEVEAAFVEYRQWHHESAADH